ncbi:hypothetical protein BDV98DRAFT_574866, partial [Pterulicium gracile]
MRHKYSDQPHFLLYLNVLQACNAVAAVSGPVVQDRGRYVISSLDPLHPREPASRQRHVEISDDHPRNLGCALMPQISLLLFFVGGAWFGNSAILQTTLTSSIPGIVRLLLLTRRYLIALCCICIAELRIAEPLMIVAFRSSL